jgi:hypothetical protein
VQRYGVRLRQQLEAIKLAPDQVRALAAAGKRARNSADDLTAITVQQILQQTLAILLQAPEPCGLFGRADTSSNAAGSGKASDSGETADESGTESTVPADAQPKPIDVSTLVRLTRITVDLGRMMKGQSKPTEQPIAQKLRTAARHPRSKSGAKRLPEEVYQTFRNALRAEPPLAPSAAMPLLEETSASPGEPSAEPAQSPAAPVEIPAEPVQPTCALAAPSEAQPSPLETQSNPPEPTQPQLTAPDRIYPHHTVYRVPIESVTNWVWPTLVFPKLVGFPRPGTTMPSPDTPAPAADKTDEPPKRSGPDQTRGSS